MDSAAMAARSFIIASLMERAALPAVTVSSEGGREAESRVARALGSAVAGNNNSRVADFVAEEGSGVLLI